MRALLDRARRERSPDLESWQPVLLTARDPALGALLESGRVLAVHDTLIEQLEELVETRFGERKLSGDEKRERVETHLAGTPPEEHGTWVFYPWSGRLVHVLPERELRELRTSRNRNKITAAEQERLRGARVGVAGLSVGQATAVTAALEGIAGELRLADFDRLSLSNLNRLRAPLESIGVNKAVLTAREIYGFDPYAKIVLFQEGLHEENLDAFLTGSGLEGGGSTGGGGPLSILFEECDDLRMKVRLRERARELRIPVLMETSDRGLFDVERFDEEPDRPIFHGLTGDLRADQLTGLSSYEKVPVVLEIIGAGTMTRRMAASLVDIDATLRTWPQLASAVALGGAINTDVARRILLGQHHGSGRFYVDLERTIAPGAGRHERAALPVPQPVLEPEPEPVPELRPARWPLSTDDVRALVAHATLAPSGGNCQPWRFAHREGAIRCLVDRDRARSFLDYGGRATALTFGCVAENLVLAAGRVGLAAEIDTSPDPAARELMCTARFTPAERPLAEPDAELARAIPLRVTNRRHGAAVALDEAERRALESVAREAGAHLAILSSRQQLEEAASVVAAADRIRLLHEQMHREMMSEMRWTPEEVARTRDGLDVETMDFDPTERAGMALLSQWTVMRTIGEVGGGAGLEKPTRKAIRASAGLALLSVDETTRAAFFRAGRAMQRVWLTATLRALGVQPMTAVVYLFARLEEGGAGLSDREREELGALRARWRALFPAAGRGEAMLFRIVRADPPVRRSLRRRLGEVLVFED